MKLIKIIIILIFVTNFCKSQTILDPPSILDSLDQSVLSTEVNEFKCAWNWIQYNRRLDEGLFMNYAHGEYTGDSLKATPNMKYISQIPGFSSGHMHYAKLNAMAVQFDPAIKVNTNSNFKAESWDNKGAIFGFQTKSKGTIDSNSQSDNFHRFVLRKDSVIQDTLVLSNSWPQDSTFYLLDYSNNPTDAYLVQNYDIDTIRRDGSPTVYRDDYPLNGTRWYLSANIKATETILPLDTIQTIMKIKLKYTLNDSTTGYIKFYKVPKQGLSSIDSLKSTIRNEFRGLTRKDSVLMAPIDYFPITNKMLRTNLSGVNNTDITLSAYFIARDSLYRTDPIPFLNPYFQPEEIWEDYHNTNLIPNLKYMKKLEVEVYYCGIKNCALDWVRLETEQAKKLLTGQYDQEFIDSCQNLVDKTKNTTLNNKLHRFYVFDEFLRPYMSAIRYSNKLVGGNAQTEFEFSVLPSLKMIDHSLGLREYWNGNSVKWLLSTANPYYSYGISKASTIYDNRKTLGTEFGSSGVKRDTATSLLFKEISFDSLNSGYETFLSDNGLGYNRLEGVCCWGWVPKPLPSQTTWTDNTLNTFYNTAYTNTPNAFQYSIGSLYNIEQQLFKLYYQKDALFINKPIHFNMWVVSEGWYFYKDLSDTNKSLAFVGSQSTRPISDSEFNLTARMPLILGVKGLFYWLKTSFNWKVSNPLEFKDTSFPNTIALQTQNNMEGDDGIDSSIVGLNYILDNRLGGDYMVPYDDPNFSYHYKPNGQYDFANLGVDQNHVFLGTRSVRYEMYKFHKYINAVEQELLDLSLVCWLGVGHRKWYVQDPVYGEQLLGDTLLNSICISKNIKTRKLWQPRDNQQGYVPTAYDPDSSDFFDLTILKKKDVELATSYIMGISNRRTDQLIHTYSIPNNTWQLDYVPSSLFDTLCQGPDQAYWKSMLWKKLGCREISICMKDTSVPQNTEIAYRITELGYDNDSLKKEYWFNPPFNHLIDTNLLYGDTLRICLQPGQAKLLNVEVVTPWTLTTGTLEYSNQTKLVAFPCESNFNANGTDTMGMVRYHSVYSSIYDTNYNYSNVYYRRSLPMNRLEKDIRWEAQEYQLNDTLVVKDCFYPQKTVCNLPSNFPSLVVRCDTIDNDLVPMVYVVYQGNTEFCSFGTKLRIIENVFPANVTELNIPWGQQIDEFTSGRGSFNSTGYSLWGIPVINASAHGNYYAWNDSLLGIVAGFKLPSDRGWIAPSQKTNFQGILSINGYNSKAYHPSLNTYSTISDNERDCAIVWEETPYGLYFDWNKQIFYTRLKYCPEFGLVHYVTKSWADTSGWYHNAVYNTDSSIIRIDITDYSVTMNHLPMVHRDVDYYNAGLVPEYDGEHPHIFKQDRIYWQARATDSDNRQGIYMKYLTIFDDLTDDFCIPNSPSCWLIEGTPRILSATNDLAHPNVAPGKLVKRKTPAGILFYSYSPFDNDSVAVINFVEYPHDPINMYEVPRTADIWQINHGYFSLFYGPNTYNYTQDFANYAPNAHKIGDKGKSSHLARIPYINNDKTWEYGHRIYESSSDPAGQFPLIKSYDYLLFKKSYDKDANYLFYGFVDTLGNSSVFTPIYITIDGREHSFVPKFNKTNKIDSDTLFSDYFEIGNYQDIDMIHFGSNKKCLDLKLQRKYDKKLFSIQTDKKSEKFDYTRHNVHLLNGKSKEYRFAWIKTSKSNFNETTMLGLPPINEINKDELIGKTALNIDENYLDLSEDITSEIPKGSSLYIYPNPANEKVVIFYEQENKSNINISIYGMLGNTIRNVFTGYIEKGKYQYSVNTKDIPAGIYFVRVEGNNKTIVKKLVIE